MRYDACVIGGGPAGLQAALTLGRMGVRTLLVDSGEYRNAASAHLHDLLGWDGSTPSALREKGREELNRYGVDIRDSRVDGVSRDAEGFTLSIEGGTVTVAALVLAVGVRDAPSPIPGVDELWGSLALVCPYCHGYEFAGRPIALLSRGPHADHVGGLLARLASELTVVDPGCVARVEPQGDGVRVHRTDEEPVDAACVFVASAARPSGALAEDLGLETVDGAIVVDARQRTSVPGVWAAGDATLRRHPYVPASVAVALGAGLIAGADCAASDGLRTDRRRAG